jgi:hypothetical protein
VAPTLLTFTSVGGAAQQFSVTQIGPSGGLITIAQPACNGGASANDSPNSVPVGGPTAPPRLINVNAVAAPTSVPPPTHACSILVTGGNGATATVNVDITATSIIVHGKRASTGADASPTPAALPQPTVPAHGVSPPSPPGSRPPHR